MSISPDVVALFDSTASKSFAQTDERISRGTYVRILHFEDAIRAHLSQPSSVLDYGCGRGRISRMIAQLGHCVDARDPSVESLRSAREQDLDGLDITFEELLDSGECLACGSYDAIVCSSVVEFVEDPETVLANLLRALRPGGVFIISFANRASLWRIYIRVRFPQAKHRSYQAHLWYPRAFKTLLTRCGFVEPRIRAYFEPPADATLPVALRKSSPLLGTLGLATARKPE